MADMADVEACNALGASDGVIHSSTPTTAAAVEKLIARKMDAIEKLRKSTSFKRRRWNQKKIRFAFEKLAIEKAAAALAKKRKKQKLLKEQLAKEELEFAPREEKIGLLKHELDEYFEAHKVLLDPFSLVPAEVRGVAEAACGWTAPPSLARSMQGQLVVRQA